MYAGAAPSAKSSGNSAPQIVRFLAKGNRIEYAYVAQNQWWGSGINTVKKNTISYLRANMVSPPAGRQSVRQPAQWHHRDQSRMAPAHPKGSSVWPLHHRDGPVLRERRERHSLFAAGYLRPGRSAHHSKDALGSLLHLCEL